MKLITGIFIGITIGIIICLLSVEWKKCHKQVEKIGTEYESCYMDLIQCQRVIEGTNDDRWLNP